MKFFLMFSSKTKYFDKVCIGNSQDRQNVWDRYKELEVFIRNFNAVAYHPKGTVVLKLKGCFSLKVYPHAIKLHFFSSCVNVYMCCLRWERNTSMEECEAPKLAL